MKTAFDDIERVIVIINERSTNAHKAQHYIDLLRASQPDKKVAVVTNGQNEATNRQQLVTTLYAGKSDRQLIIVAGGDGSAHYTMKALMHPAMPTEYRHTPFTVWPMGNGNDFFNGIHNKKEADPLSILTSSHATIKAVHPLEWHAANRPPEDLILTYTSIGVTAKAAAAITGSTFREKRKKYGSKRQELADVVESAKSFWFPQRFPITLDKRHLSVAEMQFVNGPLMARYAYYPMRFDDPAMHVAVVKRHDPATVLSTVLRFRFTVGPGKRHAEPISFALEGQEPVNAQIDGECFMLPPGPVTIAPSKEYVMVWMTK